MNQNLINPQGYQTRFTGLEATPTGSTNTSVARIAAAVPLQNTGNVTAVEYLTIADTAADGTSWKISRRGVYQVEVSIGVGASANLIAALTVDTSQLAVAPTIANAATRDFARITAGTAPLGHVKLGAPILISQEDAGDATAGIVRVLITDEAGAAPPAGELQLGNFQIMFTRMNDLHMAS